MGLPSQTGASGCLQERVRDTELLQSSSRDCSEVLHVASTLEDFIGFEPGEQAHPATEVHLVAEERIGELDHPGAASQIRLLAELCIKALDHFHGTPPFQSPWSPDEISRRCE